MKVEGKVALVTGGASGIGKALTQRLLENEIKFVSIVDCDDDAGQETIREFTAKFGTGRVRFIQCDVTDEKLLRKSFQETYDKHKALDIVVNNAGILSKDHRKTINVNLIAVLNGVVIANDVMSKNKRSEKGVIVNTASLAGLNVYPEDPIGYTASKHGVVGLTKAFNCSSDGFSQDLRAVAICPVGVPTDIYVRNAFMNEEEACQLDKELKRINLCISMSSAVDAFIQAIEDDTLSGACIKVEASGTTFLTNQ